MTAPSLPVSANGQHRAPDGSPLSTLHSSLFTGPALTVDGLTRLFGPGCPDCISLTGPEHETNTCASCGTLVACTDVSFERETVGDEPRAVNVAPVPMVNARRARRRGY